MKKSKEQIYIESLIVKEPKLKAFLNENNLYLNEFGLQTFSNMAQSFKQKLDRVLADPKTERLIQAIADNMTAYDAVNIAHKYANGDVGYALAYVPAWSALSYIQKTYGDQIAAAVVQKAAKAKQAITQKAKNIAAPMANTKTGRAITNAGKIIGSGLDRAADVVNAGIRNIVPVLKGTTNTGLSFRY